MVVEWDLKQSYFHVMELFNTYISEKAPEAVADVLRSGWLNEGQKVLEFEECLGGYGLTNAVAVNSCTSALHLSLVCAGVKPGDEVILPAQTFIATGIAVLMAGGVPIFVDIDPLTGNICPKSIAENVTAKTAAIIVVHWGGSPCDLDAVYQIAGNIPVIEDAAHALGASYNDVPIGMLSRFTCFSFQSIKFLTTGDGGAVCTNDPETWHELKRRRWFGFDKSAPKSVLGERLPASELGFKYHMNNIAAALGLANLDRTFERLHRRRKIAEYYRSEFANVRGITLLKQVGESANWLFTLLADDRDKYFGKEIPVSVVDRRIDLNPIFDFTPDLKGQEYFDQHQFSIPVHDALTDSDVESIVKFIKET